MALPVASTPRSPDVAIHDWAGITVQVAWTLLTEGVRVNAQVLRDLRTHAILHLEPADSAQSAEDRAAMLTEAFVARARGRFSDPWPEDREMPLSPRWRRAIDASLTPASRVVFRQHYGNRRKLEHVAEMAAADRLGIQTARAGLRETVRRVAKDDGLPLDRWEPERIDQLLRRLAAFSPGPCPPIVEVVEGTHLDHASGCSRCDRATRLVQAGVVALEDLIPPSLGARSSPALSVLVLQFHQDGRNHRTAVREELADAYPVGDDLLFVDATHPELERVLALATELGRPPRNQIRGILVGGPGQFCGHGLLGPLLERGAHEVRGRAWGEVDGMGPLPEPLPPPPSAAGVWWVVAGLSATAAALALSLLSPAPSPASLPLEARFANEEHGFWIQFDVADEAFTPIVVERDGRLEIVLQGVSPAEKGEIATGDGAYRGRFAGSGILLASLPTPLPELRAFVDAAARAPDGLEALAQAIRDHHPEADVALHRNRPLKTPGEPPMILR